MTTEYGPPDAVPELVILISGKRKCGKDYLMDLLQKRLDEKKIEVGVIRISAPIKHFWSEKHSLDFSRLLDASSYKEDHRLGMVNWSMKHRDENPGYFPVEAIKMANASGKPIWICVDMRHQGDYDWFLKYYSSRLKRVRVTADESVRSGRGWTFQDGVDDTASECALDHVTDWDLIVHNNDDGGAGITKGLDTIMTWIQTSLAKVQK